MTATWPGVAGEKATGSRGVKPPANPETTACPRPAVYPLPPVVSPPHLCRYERSGTMHGLFRVRGFTQDDAHIFCLPSQIASEIKGVLDLTEEILSTFGFTKYEINLSTRPEKSVGDDDIWATAEAALKEALGLKGWDYLVDEVGAGPGRGPAWARRSGRVFNPGLLVCGGFFWGGGACFSAVCPCCPAQAVELHEPAPLRALRSPLPLPFARAAARSTAPRSTSRSRTRWAASGSAPPSSWTSTCRCASTWPTSTRTPRGSGPS